MSEKILHQLADEYITNIKNLANLVQNKVVVFDFDGVMVKFKYAENKLLPCKYDDFDNYCKHNSFYDNAQAVKTIQYIAGLLNPDDIYVLTVSADTVKTSKTNKILSSFNIKPSHIIHVSEPCKKNAELKKIYEKTKKEIVFLEDTDRTLINAEDAFDFVKGYHISSLLA